MKKKAGHPIRKILLILLGLVLLTGAGMAIYLSVYYHADEEAEAVAAGERAEADRITVISQKDYLAFVPEQPSCGLIFYSGAKVEDKAYAPLMTRLAERGILCVLPHLTANVAFLDMNAADGIEEDFPDTDSWYIGGHSLGGVVACMYADRHAGDFKGVILLASYSSADLSDDDLSALSLYGSEDGVLSKEQYEDAKQNLPEDYREVVIPGGCHAYFGNYGEQKGDGIPSITREEQQEQTCRVIYDFTESCQ